jgi:hypothetical protein
MVQTLTPPSPNVNAAAATAVALSSSTIPLSPGGTPVAAIAAAAAAAVATAAATANASAMSMSPGGMPVAAISLNIGGMNLNIMLTPLEVGGGQQNSGNSASLQPTTQSNLGLSAGLFGGFGPTHLGSTSTTTGTSGSNYVPRKKGSASMLSPYIGSINPLSSTGIAKYINFVKSWYNKRIGCSVGNRNLIFAGLAKKAKQYSMAILRVPISGTGKMARAPLTINTISLANGDLGSCMNILSKHTTKLTKDQLHAYMSWC